MTPQLVSALVGGLVGSVGFAVGVYLFVWMYGRWRYRSREQSVAWTDARRASLNDVQSRQDYDA